MSSDTFTNKSPNHGDNKNDTNNNNNNKTPLSHYLINEAFGVLVSEHAFLTDTHNTLCANYRSLERDLRWYSDTLVAVHANYQQLEVDYQRLEVDYEQLEAAHRALEAERDDAVGENARMGLKAKRGTFGGRGRGREKMGEVWRTQGEFVWVKVEERGWVKMAKRGLEGVERCGGKVKRCLWEVREECREMGEARSGRRVERVVLREDLAL